MSNHGKGVNAIDDTTCVSSIEDLITLLTIMKGNLLRVGVFHGCSKDCVCCDQQVNGCKRMKEDVQRLINSREILFDEQASYFDMF